jgi:hypothetical protein
VRALIATLLCLGLIGLAGCSPDGGGDGERAVPLDGDAASGEATSEETDEAELASHQQELTTEQAEQALLTVQELPTGWAAGHRPRHEPSGQDVVEPARCEDLLGSLEGSNDEEPVAEAQAHFTNGGPSGVQLVESIDSYAEPVAEDIAATAGALEECSEFTTVNAKGVRTRFEVAEMSFPNVGDETLALQVVMEQEGLQLNTSVVIVAVGHNTVSLVGGGFIDVPARELEQIAHRAVAKLEETA